MPVHQEINIFSFSKYSLPRFFSPPREIYYPSQSNSLPTFPIFFSKNTISSPIFPSFNYSNPLGKKIFFPVPNISVLIFLCFSLPQGSLFFIISVYPYPKLGRFYKKLGPFYKKLRSDKFGSWSISTKNALNNQYNTIQSSMKIFMYIVCKTCLLP